MKTANLELGKGAILVEDGVPLLDELALLLARRQHHRLVRTGTEASQAAFRIRQST